MARGLTTKKQNRTPDKNRAKPTERGKDHFALLIGEAGEDELAKEVEQHREREDDGRVETDLDRDRERLDRTDGADLLRLLRDVGDADRVVDDFEQLLVEDERGDGEYEHRDDDFHQRAAQVIEMVEERLFGILPTFLRRLFADLEQLLEKEHGARLGARVRVSDWKHPFGR